MRAPLVAARLACNIIIMLTSLCGPVSQAWPACLHIFCIFLFPCFFGRHCRAPVFNYGEGMCVYAQCSRVTHGSMATCCWCLLKNCADKVRSISSKRYAVQKISISPKMQAVQKISENNAYSTHSHCAHLKLALSRCQAHTVHSRLLLSHKSYSSGNEFDAIVFHSDL